MRPRSQLTYLLQHTRALSKNYHRAYFGRRLTRAQLAHAIAGARHDRAQHLRDARCESGIAGVPDAHDSQHDSTAGAATIAANRRVDRRPAAEDAVSRSSTAIFLTLQLELEAKFLASGRWS